MKGSLFATSLLAFAGTIAAAATVQAAEPKYYFQIKEVTAAPDVDASVKTAAVETLKAELASRTEWASDIKAGGDQTALAEELNKRKLRGFDVTLRIENFKQEMKDPRPGGRLKQLAVNVKLVVIGATNDIALYRELMKRGVSDYLVPPLQPLSIIQAITTLYADPSAPFVGRSIAFVGAKGGVGSSTIAHNFGYCLTEYMQTNAVIVDFDLPFGTAGLDFNQDPLQGVIDALTQPDRLDPVLLERMMVRCSERLSLFAAPATLDNDYDITADAFEEVALKIKNTAPFVIFDLPHVWSAWMRKLLLTSDDVVIVATADLASLRNAKNMIDLVRGARPNDQPPRLVLNQMGIPGRPEIPVKDFGDALGLEPSVVLPFDAKLFGAAANNGQMVAELQAKSKAAEGLNMLAQMISRREPPAPVKKSFLSSLLKK